MAGGMTQFLIEGVDRLGKSSLIERIQQSEGFFFTYHFAKPKKLEYYSYAKDQLREYQYESFEEMFNLMQHKSIPIIFDRAHLGEAVYAKRYRGYDADYIFQLEYDYAMDVMKHTKLILLATSDFGFIADDGDSFDFSKKEEEQADFIAAFNRSILPNKVMIDVHNGYGEFKTREEILKEALQ